MGKKTTDTKTTTAARQAPARKSGSMAKSARRANPAAVAKTSKAASPTSTSPGADLNTANAQSAQSSQTSQPSQSTTRRKSPRAGSGSRNGHSSSGAGSEQIAVRAYYIAERRRAAGLPGNPTEDWMTAEREILAEIKR